MNPYSEIRKQLLTQLSKNGEYESRYWKGADKRKLRQDIENLIIPGFDSMYEKIWGLWNNIFDRPVCVVCGQLTAFNNFKHGFYRTCSVKCGANDPERNAKIKATELERYPEGHHTRTKDYRKTVLNKYGGVWPGSFGTESHKAAIKKKYGVDNVFQSEEIKDRIKLSNVRKYGVKNVQQNSVIKNQTKATNVRKYGRACFNPAKTKATMQERYGVDNALQSPDIREKIRLTCQEKYGVDHVMQDPKIFERCQKAQQRAAYKYKDYVSPSGKLYKVQGYEGPVINYLLQAGIAEDDLTNTRFEVPIIQYFFNKKERIYFPDIYIKSKRMLVEVKSTYTYSREVNKNLAKQNAAKDLGYHHIIIVWDAVNDSIIEII